jgi:hypothetical protein
MMSESRDRSLRAAALTRVHEELIAELDDERGSRRCTELQPLIADLEWTLGQCRRSTDQCSSPDF